MKQPFRFFRGELNGYYIRAFMLSRNAAVADILEELAYHARLAWKLADEVTSSETPVRDGDLVGVAKFAGVDRPIQYLETTVGSERLSLSHVVDGSERSERGLFDVVAENYVFVRTGADEYPTDIATEASSTRRMGLVPEGTVPVGYVAYGTDIFDAAGNLIPGNLLSAPPSDGTPYTEYYGDKYLFLEELFHNNVSMPVEVFKEYYEHIMRLRRGGAAIAELEYLTELLCGGYVHELLVVPNGSYYTLSYSLDTTVTVTNKSGRLAAWRRIVEKRFPDFVLNEVEA